MPDPTNYQADLGGMMPGGGSPGVLSPASSVPYGGGGNSMGWIAPAIGGVASLGGTVLGGKAQQKAAKQASEAQLAGTREALAFQREQEAQRQANFDRAYNIWNASRNALLERYGIDIADVPGAAPGAPPGGAVPAAGAMPPAAAMARPAPAAMPSTIGDMIAAKGPVDPWATRNPFTA